MAQATVPAAQAGDAPVVEEGRPQGCRPPRTYPERETQVFWFLPGAEAAEVLSAEWRKRAVREFAV
jgi:hypothetical protein